MSDDKDTITIDLDQMRQIIAAVYEVMRCPSGYGEVTIRIDKGRPMFISRVFEDRLLPRRLKPDDAG